jgi:hypothetical protein
MPKRKPRQKNFFFTYAVIITVLLMALVLIGCHVVKHERSVVVRHALVNHVAIDWRRKLQDAEQYLLNHDVSGGAYYLTLSHLNETSVAWWQQQLHSRVGAMQAICYDKSTCILRIGPYSELSLLTAQESNLMMTWGSRLPFLSIEKKYI